MIADPVRLLLARLDMAIEGAVLRLRGRYQLSLDEYRGLYVSDEQVDALLLSRGMSPARLDDLPPLPPISSLARLKAVFALDAIELDLLVLAASASIEPRYPTLFSYLNDDVARRLPTVDLAQRLFAGDALQRRLLRERLAPVAPLRRHGLLMLGGEEEGSLATLSAPPAVVAYLIGDDPLLAAGLTRIDPANADTDPDESAVDALRMREAGTGAVLLISGRDEAQMRRHASAVCSRLGQAISCREEGDAIGGMAADRLACALGGSALLIAAGSTQPPALWPTAPTPVIICTSEPAAWQSRLAAYPVVHRDNALPDLAARQDHWRDQLRTAGLRASPATIRQTAARFRLHGSAIARAARDARIALAGADSNRVSTATLLESSRRQARLDLGELADAVLPRHGWSDLVLPAAVTSSLRDLADACSLRGHVYEDWGMSSGGRGNGLAALFCGNSGTGKTMSAGVVAAAAGLDMWRIDLSTVVSKYIGETEKNLEKIFTAARDGDAILFFDEADAIFGKRSEVHDAHDRYANIEVAYMLQRLEEHDGVVILASNFRANIDTAFLRRLHFVIEFPMPDAGLRERMWRGAFPPRVPLAGDLDHALLARQFALTGGDIRTAALDAAFLAAGEGSPVAMQHILRGITRQLLKQGRVPPRSHEAPPRIANGAQAAAS